MQSSKDTNYKIYNYVIKTWKLKSKFGGQEPKPEAEIKEFVKQYNVQFDMFSKINVNGDGAHPLYKFLKSKVDGTFGNFIKWNFSKFLINREGVPVKRYSPTTEPKSIEKDILELLNNKSALWNFLDYLLFKWKNLT